MQEETFTLLIQSLFCVVNIQKIDTRDYLSTCVVCTKVEHLEFS